MPSPLSSLDIPSLSVHCVHDVPCTGNWKYTKICPSNIHLIRRAAGGKILRLISVNIGIFHPSHPTIIMPIDAQITQLFPLVPRDRCTQSECISGCRGAVFGSVSFRYILLKVAIHFPYSFWHNASNPMTHLNPAHVGTFIGSTT